MNEIRNTRLRSILVSAGWILLGLEIVFAIAVTGIAGSASAGFSNALQCDVPDKLNYNLAIAIITFVLLLVLSALTFANHRYYGVKWHHKLWIGVFSSLVILWAAALGTSFYTCSDLCSACAQPVPVMIIYAGRCCNCAGVDGTTVDFCQDGGADSLIGFERIHHWYTATQGLDGVILVLMISSALVAVVSLRVKNTPVTTGGEAAPLHDFAVEQNNGTTKAAFAEPPAYQA